MPFTTGVSRNDSGTIDGAGVLGQLVAPVGFAAVTAARLVHGTVSGRSTACPSQVTLVRVDCTGQNQGP